MTQLEEYQKIYNRPIALKLRDMGNPIRDAVPNAKNLGLVVYLFEKTEKLKSDMDEIFKK